MPPSRDQFYRPAVFSLPLGRAGEGVVGTQLQGQSFGYQAVDGLTNLLYLLHYLLVGKSHYLIAVLGQSGVALASFARLASSR